MSKKIVQWYLCVLIKVAYAAYTYLKYAKQLYSIRFTLSSQESMRKLYSNIVQYYKDGNWNIL